MEATSSEKNAISKQTAAPMPRSHATKLVLKANTLMSSVELPGPPSVRTCTISNVFEASIVRNMTARMIIGRSRGS